MKLTFTYAQSYSGPGIVIKSINKEFGRSLIYGGTSFNLSTKEVIELIALLEEALTIEENGFEIITNAFKENARGLYLGCCPFHTEQTPSCVYYPLKDIFRCFGCGQTGETQTLAAQLLKVASTQPETI